MGKIFSVIFMNFWGFDFIIFLAAVFNGFVFYMVKVSADRIKAKMNHTVYVPHFRFSKNETEKQVSALREEDVLSLKSSSDKFYALFVNITGIFPLLGILGTVVSLLGLQTTPPEDAADALAIAICHIQSVIRLQLAGVKAL